MNKFIKYPAIILISSVILAVLVLSGVSIAFKLDLFHLKVEPFGGKAGDGCIFHEPFESLSDMQANGADYSNISIVEDKVGETVMGNSVLIDDNDVLYYSTLGKFNKNEGTIEFWVKPNWHANDGKNHVFFDNRRNSNSYGFLIYRHSSGKLLLNIRTRSKQGSDYTIRLEGDVSDWKAGEWHFVKATFKSNDKVKLYIDSKKVAEKFFIAPPSTNSKIFLSGFVDENGNASSYGISDAVIDELRTYSTVKDPPQLPSFARGVFSLFSNRGQWDGEMKELDYDFVDGLSIAVTWHSLEPSEGRFEWSEIENAIAKAREKNKKVNIHLVTNARVQYLFPHWHYFHPPWLEHQKDVETFETIWAGVGKQKAVILIPWDPVYKEYLKKFIMALGEKYNNNEYVNFITTSGAGFNEETSSPILPPYPDFLPKFEELKRDKGYTEKKVTDLWKEVIDWYAEAFPNKYLAFAPHGIYKDDARNYGDINNPKSSDAALELMDYSNKKYGDKVVFFTTDLSDKPSGSWPPSFEYIVDKITSGAEAKENRIEVALAEMYSKTNPGGQMRWRSEAGNAGDMWAGSIGRCMNFANKLNMTWVEVWAEDILTPWAPGDGSTAEDCFDELQWAHKCLKENNQTACDKLEKYRGPIDYSEERGCDQIDGWGSRPVRE